LADLPALELSRALSVCAAAGWSALVRLTAPPGGGADGPARVVRCAAAGDRCLVLTVARETRKGGVACGLPHYR